MKKKQKQEISLYDAPVLPSNTLEEKFLYALLANDSALNVENMRLVYNVVDSTCFTSDEAKKCWATMIDKAIKHEDVTLITVSKNNAFVIRTLAKHAADTDLATTPTTFVSQAFELRRLQLTRELSDKLIEGQELIQTNADIDTLRAYGGRWAGYAAAEYGGRDKGDTLPQIFNELCEELREEEDIKIATGWPSLNTFTFGGFSGGNLVVLAGRPGTGKTTLALQLARDIASSGEHTVFFALEMSRNELAKKLLYATGIITPNQLRTRAFHWQTLEMAIARYGKTEMRIYDRDRKIDRIADRIANLAQAGKCKVAVIDYLQLIEPAYKNKETNRATEISEMTRVLKNTAMDCRIPIVVLSQLNRNSASENRSPELYDLRESGSIEQDGDIVLMLEKCRDLTVAVSDDNLIDMWIKKNRAGKVPSAPIRLKGDEFYSNFLEVQEQ